MLEIESPCKVNLVLNILGKRADGFHELESIMLPVPLNDRLRLAQAASGITLTCTDRSLAVDATNLVHRAATAFLSASGITSGLTLHLEKRIPMAAGLGGGSGNAATTLRGLNELFGNPLPATRLQELAAALGSDVPFFLQRNPALVTGRGETVESLRPFASLAGRGLFLVHPGFGISTPWAYQQLARFPKALNGRSGLCREFVQAIETRPVVDACRQLYNSLEAPAHEKFPILALYQEFLRKNGALGTLMSGSGSTTFALFDNASNGRVVEQRFRERFGDCWTAVVTL
jgi:4-diphosphocytidyl-2-C-methyl-D-erythritol kinase